MPEQAGAECVHRAPRCRTSPASTPSRNRPAGAAALKAVALRAAIAGPERRTEAPPPEALHAFSTGLGVGRVLKLNRQSSYGAAPHHESALRIHKTNIL